MGGGLPKCEMGPVSTGGLCLLRHTSQESTAGAGAGDVELCATGDDVVVCWLSSTSSSVLDASLRGSLWSLTLKRHSAVVGRFFLAQTMMLKMQFCNFMFCYLVLHFHVLYFHVLQRHVLQFPAMLLGPSFSCPAFSCPATWSVIFMSGIFTSCIFSAPCLRSYAVFLHPTC